MKTHLKRLAIWALSLLPLTILCLVAVFVWILSADKRLDCLREAAATNNTFKARLLMWSGTDVNSMNGNGDGAALHVAASAGNVEMMEFLIRHGAKVDQTAAYSATPLAYARINHQAAAEKLLLDHGANPDTSQCSWH